ncbi:MAG: YfcE family phosphodiesterase, partial [Candidatus Aenigmarchaeota archaeon]|nr:YfcE family phosphodiesterase [Candidatus Aenigmarchaeota archaeon]
MKILVISDTHDNIPNLEKVRNISNEEIKPEMVIHCGDIVSPFMIDELSGFNSDVHVVFGNNDGDVFNLVR